MAPTPLPKKVHSLPDPHGMIARIRSRLPKNCGVALSPYCDVIISMRMQGLPYRKIEEWLIEQGPEHRLSAPTILKNLARTQLTVELPRAEEIAERWGGAIDLDLARELAGQVLQQRQRVDLLSRREIENQKKNPNYFDKRIKGERETLEGLIKTLHGMMKSPIEAAMERTKADEENKNRTVEMTDDAASLLTTLILDGEIKVGL